MIENLYTINQHLFHTLLTYMFSKIFYSFRHNYNTQSVYLQMMNMMSMFVTIMVVYYVTNSDQKTTNTSMYLGMFLGAYVAVYAAQYFESKSDTYYQEHAGSKYARGGAKMLYFIIVFVVIALHFVNAESAVEYGSYVLILVTSIWLMYASLPSKLPINRNVYKDGKVTSETKEVTYDMNVNPTYAFLLPLFLFMGNIDNPIVKLFYGVFLGGFIGSVNMFGYYYFINEQSEITENEFLNCKHDQCSVTPTSSDSNDDVDTKAESSKTLNIISITAASIVFLILVGGGFSGYFKGGGDEINKQLSRLNL
jgi:hypothetical protein